MSEFFVSSGRVLASRGFFSCRMLICAVYRFARTAEVEKDPEDDGDVRDVDRRSIKKKNPVADEPQVPSVGKVANGSSED